MSIEVNELTAIMAAWKRVFLRRERRDEWENRHRTVIGFAVRLRAGGTAGGSASTAAGSSIRGRGNAGGSFRQHPEGELRRPVEVVAGRSRRRIDVLYRLSVVARAGCGRQCTHYPRHRVCG